MKIQSVAIHSALKQSGEFKVYNPEDVVLLIDGRPVTDFEGVSVEIGAELPLVTLRFRPENLEIFLEGVSVEVGQ